MLVQLHLERNQYYYHQLTVHARVTYVEWRELMFLMYPVLGHLADVCLNRYRTIRWSFLPVLCGNTIALLVELVSVILLGIIGLKITHEP